ncbi:uncharacterized protein LOC131683496 isoform X1 [Topomyia yanbarensis]|uniref:uncharacterized protein LOC131683496 isoform X1 n=1 Tax=Topomyia yanbarensis TaxID=2498891 RepID=UPI00273BB1A9|nr:uncharacterized protein LOC131683496 isoform X1 [Topomyia yanbarensis]
MCFNTGCQQKFTRVNDYIVHLKTHNLDKPLRLVCTFTHCTQKFTTMYRFSRHLKTHLSTRIDTMGGEQIPNNVFEYPASVDVPATERTHTLTYQTEDVATPISIHESLKAVDQRALSFILDLHKRRNFTRKDVVQIQKGIKELYTNLEQLIRLFAPVAADPQSKYIFDIVLGRISTMFDIIDTEHKLFKHLRELDLMRPPQILTIQSGTITEMSGNDVELENKKTCMVLMDIKFQIKKFLESENVLKEIKEHTNKVAEQSSICHFVNGLIYRRIQSKYSGKTIIPISLYTDEFEINDPLSSHAKKHCICGLYYGFPTLPEQYKAKLCNIFIAGAIKKHDIAEHGVEKFFKHVIEKFKDLELNGILINVNGDDQRVYIVLMLVQGDNLGIHQILKFSGSFSAKHYCRFCKRTKDLLSTDDKECIDDLRSLKNYNSDVLIKQSQSGLVGKSIFNDLPSFHVIENLYADVMHDLYSTGVCYYGFVEIINHCIYKAKYCTISDVNKRRKELNNYRLEQGLSRMPDIEESTIKSKKCVSLRMTANEMYVFSIYFTFIFGSFFPSDDPVWKYATILISLIDMINSPVFTSNDLDQLTSLVSEHHKLYISLFQQSLKPKQHFLTHYSRIIKHSGPLKKISCFRYEARHRDFKQYFDNTSSRKNPCYTMCVKAGLFFTYDIINNNFFKSEAVAEFMYSTWAEKTYFNRLTTTFEISSDEHIQTTKSLTYKNIKYIEGLFLTVTFESIVEIYQIVEVVKYKLQLFVIVCQWSIKQYNEHYQAFEIDKKNSNIMMIGIDMFDGPPFALEQVGNLVLFRRRTYAYENFE